MDNVVTKPPRLLFFVTEDWYFCSHRLPVARAARDAGFQVIVATRVQRHADEILREGFKLVPIHLRRRNGALWQELQTVRELVRLYRVQRPDIVHHIAMKPLLYGAIAARLARTPAVVNAIAGLGYLFSSRQWRAKALRRLVIFALRLVLDRQNSRAIVQNPHDSQVLIDRRLVRPERIALICGSGVDTERLHPFPETAGDIVVTTVSRMLWDKGIADLVEAARLLARRGVTHRFLLVGAPDPENPTSIPEAQLREWHAEGIIDWRGQQSDIGAVWAASHIAVLPSYREGLPKSLLEAAACGRPMIATDVPGCREVVRHGETGLLVPPRDPPALASAIETLAGYPRLRCEMGSRARELVVSEFSEGRVARQTLEVYRELLRTIIGF